MKKFYLLFAIIFLPFVTFSQGHILGSFPSLDGGFENQPVSGTTTTGATPFSSTQSNYTDNNAGTTATFKSSGGRSGAQYLEVTTLGSGQGFYTPTAALAQNTSYVVQYYFRYNGSSNRSMIVAASPDGGANFGANSTANNVSFISSWTKRTEVITSANTASNSFGIVRFNSSGGVISTVFDIDDIVVYAGASADVTAPSAATSPVISNASSTSQNLSWTAPAGGVDGGGYVVVRYAASPAATDDPNQNGIYDVASSVTGTVTGTVVYIGTSTSFVSTGLTGGINYYYKIYTADKAFNYSSELTTNLATSCTGQWTGSVSTNWATAGNWCGSVVPTSSTDVVIPSTATQPTISSSVSCKSLTINSGATVTTSAAGTLNITGNITNSGTMTNSGTTNFSGTSQQTFSGVTTFNNVILNNAGGLLLGGAVTINGDLTITSGTLATNNYNITLSGNLVNNGTFTAGTSTVTFTGSANNTVTGSSTTAFNNVAVNKGTDATSILDVQSLITMAGGGLTLTNGTFKLSSNSTITIFYTDITTAPYRIPSTAGLWVNGGTVSTTGNITFAGLIQVSNGTLNVGSASDVKLLPANGATFILDGGVVNVAGRFSYATVSDVISFTMSAGTLNVSTAGSTVGVASFNIINSGSSFTMSGGTIAIIRAGTTNLGYFNAAGTSTVTGGTLQIGNASTPVSSTMQINSTPPIWNLTVNSTNSPVAQLAAAFTVKGDVTISGGTLDANNFDLTVAGNWANSGTFTSGTATVTFNGTTIMSGSTATNTFNNLTVAASSTVTSSASITGMVVNGTLTTGALATLDLGTTTILSGTLGTISNSGTIKTSVPTTTSATPIPSGKSWGGTIDYANAGANQTVIGGTYNNLTVRPGNAKTATASGNLVVNGTLFVTTAFGAFDLSTYVLSGTLTSINNLGDIRTSVPTTTSATPIPAGKTWNGTIYYNATAGAQTVVGGTYNILRFTNTSGTNTASGDLTVNNQFVTAAGGTLDMGSSYRIINMSGAITNNGTVKTSMLSATGTAFPNKIWGGTGTVEYAVTTGAQTVVIGTYNNLKLDNTSGTNTLSGNVTMNGIITLSGGTVTTGSYVISITSGASLSRTSGGHVIGNLKKNIATGATSATFEIGDATNYTPATVAFASVTTAQYLTATVTATEHPNLAGSGIRTDKSVNRYWSFTNQGVVFTTATLTVNWVAGDVDAGSTTANFHVGQYINPTWTFPSYTSPLSTSIQATGLTSFGDYAVGEFCTLSGNWTGAVSTSWTNGSNWCGGVPASGTAIAIPAGLTNYPIISGGTSATLGAVTISSGASLTINSTGILTVQGAWSNSGTIVNNGRIILNGSSAQTFPGAASTVSAMNELEINNSSGTTVDNSFTITGKLLSTAGALDLANKNITLHSDTTNTAMVTQVGGSFAYSAGGKFIVERFISALSDRAYRLLSAPVNTSTTIKANWQEGSSNTASGTQIDPSPGYGTQITGTGGSANGFDVSQTNATSMYTFNQGTLAWQSVANTNVNTLNYLTGYLLYIRGDRSINLGAFSNPLPSVNTVLRASGQLVTGSVAYSSLANAGNFSLVTNPYASPIDWNLIYTGTATTNFENYYTYWDPNIGTRGGYVTVTNGNITSPANAGAAPYGTKEIQSGQAFFVRTKAGITAPSLTISETHKSTTGNLEVFSPTALQEKFSVSLFYDLNGTRRIADGALAIYRDDYSNNLGDEDAQEINNWDENIAIARAGKNLSIEGRPIITGSDTLPLFMNHMKQQAYEFEFNAQSFNHPATIIELADKFTGSRTLIDPSGITSINFVVDANAASAASDRFYVVFGGAAPLPVTLTNLKANQQGANIAVEWKVENELNIKQYEVERSADGINFIKMATVIATGRSAYNWLDVNPINGNNYYRIKSVDMDTRSKLSSIVKVNVSKEKQSITVYPNPIQNGVMSVSMVNMPKGIYDFKIVNNLGQVMMMKSINHNEGSSTEMILLEKNISAGTYILEIIKPDNTILTPKIYIK